MTIQDYLNRIEALQNEKSEIEYPNDADLEFCISQIKQINTESSFSFDALFQKRTSETKIVNNDVVKTFSDYLGLLFLEEKESRNVCFANSEEVRPEYRQSFKLIDFLDYIYAFMHSSVYKESEEIIFTSEATLFWNLVKIGSDFRKEKI
ncbi:hypothetical protein JI750_08990 [Flavobacterium sp. GN10]|uniref:Type ISP restriction-modification enzyme LLaBIII C-terminal specificity domain-containing protein n=1 Tax=Flavobacterium tagetis TaxID=2801336 RepID=A0ABS1KFU0_9FLAO|nr:hypothetical protein [Flavobacterium tagetis]MBL0737016.1 hypothetical protein [Flavobacterium tagetis]